MKSSKKLSKKPSKKAAAKKSSRNSSKVQIKELRVSAIENGTVIDHIPSDVTFKVVNILKLQDMNQTVMVAQNLKSKKKKSKGIVKVAGKALTKDEVNKIALMAPNATVNIIKNYSVSKKMKLEVPDTITNIMQCSNPKCITNNDSVKTVFHLRSKKPLKLQCHHCERFMRKQEFKILK